MRTAKHIWGNACGQVGFRIWSQFCDQTRSQIQNQLLNQVDGWVLYSWLQVLEEVR